MQRAQDNFLLFTLFTLILDYKKPTYLIELVTRPGPNSDPMRWLQGDNSERLGVWQPCEREAQREEVLLRPLQLQLQQSQLRLRPPAEATQRPLWRPHPLQVSGGVLHLQDHRAFLYHHPRQTGLATN